MSSKQTHNLFVLAHVVVTNNGEIPPSSPGAAHSLLIPR